MRAILLVVLLITMPFLAGWAGPIHQSMTKISLECLPKDAFDFDDMYRNNLIKTYCLIPDLEKTEPNYRPYIDSFLESAILTDLPEAKQRFLLHAADRGPTNHILYQYYTDIIIEKFCLGDTDEAFRYLGTFLHFIEDTSCPGHLRYGVYQHPRGEKELMPHFSSLHFFKRFMPVPKKYKDARMHKIIDGGGFSELQLKRRITGYNPKILGDNPVSIVATFKARHEQMMANSDSMLIPMMQAYFNDDERSFAEYGLNAAEPAVKLAADYTYTIFQICTHNKFKINR